MSSDSACSSASCRAFAPAWGKQRHAHERVGARLLSGAQNVLACVSCDVVGGPACSACSVVATAVL